ncbi:lysozyme inhibitor LprI family protein [Paenibacillus camerounensis]|uniref:lysozyme inhibitor LprI family protein n=1 Tax=Paenibacillus camerounensis TaxID=1243663 RepID=UPI0006946E5D|nr:lysozyme inhibitor LprI family protein [Paenibacillus camerounensis]
MKKAILLTTIMCSLALAGCGNNAQQNTNSAGSEPAAQETAAPAATAPVTAAPEETAAAATTAPAATPAAEQTPAASSVKQKYLDKLDAVEAGLSDLKEQYDSGVTASMTEAATKEYERWDKALNEVYTALKSVLSESEMDGLKEKQLEWITYRDKTAEEAAAKYEGGTMQPLEYVAVLASTTKDRSYELVNTYMK